MNQVIEAARAHFRDQLQGNLKKYHVEEWNVDIYYNSKLAWRDQSRLIDLYGANKTSDAILETILVKVKNADGTPMFTSADRQFLLNEVDPEVLMKIVNVLNSGKLTAKEVEKN